MGEPPTHRTHIPLMPKGSDEDLGKFFRGREESRETSQKRQYSSRP